MHRRGTQKRKYHYVFMVFPWLEVALSNRSRRETNKIGLNYLTEVQASCVVFCRAVTEMMDDVDITS